MPGMEYWNGSTWEKWDGMLRSGTDTAVVDGVSMPLGDDITLDDDAEHIAVLPRDTVYPRLVWVDPDDGETVSVRYRATANAPWQTPEGGDATAYTEWVLDAPVQAVSFQCGNDATASVGGIV